MKKITLLLLLFCFALPQLVAQQKGKEEKPATPSTVSLENLVKQKSSDYVITAEHTSRISGIHHLYLRQAINGLEVYGTESSVHLDKTGKAIASHNGFKENIQATVKSASASLSAEQAITKVAQQMGYKLANLHQIENIGGINKKAVYNKAGISTENIPVRLMYYYIEGRGTFMVWELSIQEIDSSDWWNFRVDANSGAIIDKDNWTVSCDINGNHEEHGHENKVVYGPQLEPTNNEIQKTSIYTVPQETDLLVGNYRVYAMPIESPNHGGRTLVANPDNPLASPFGWHDTNGVAGAEFTRSQGNNTEAYDDDNANDNPDGKYAEGGGGLVFDFPLNTTYSAGDQSESAAITNLFYWANIIHDLSYQYGFDEVSGNFQENNYGNGGLGSDYVYSEAQDGSGTCNANFGTPMDGQNPRMQMYVCGARDGDLDNVVIVHEYTHGISNRLTGGPGNVNCLNNAEQMGEGWGDWLGLMMTMETGDAGTDSRGVGTWLLGEGPGGPGIRQYPYSTDMTVNLHTYDDIKTVAVPHGVGSVWAEMLWEMSWGIIAVEGFDTDFYTGTGGNNIALALVMEGMKLQPCSPGFVDGRDAILAADLALYGGAYQCIIWEAFAKRGLGFSASQGDSGSRSDGTEAFDLPPTFSSFNAIDSICLSDGVQSGLSGGLPAGGTYGGLGVTDDGNGTTYTFDPSVPGTGTATVTYSVNDACTGTPTVLTDTIEITNEPPVIICMGSGSIPTTVTETVSPGVPIPDGNPAGVSTMLNVPDDFIIADLNVNLEISHTWVGDVIVTLQSPAGTVVTIFDRPGVPASTFGCNGDNILATLDDEAGNQVEIQCAGSVPTINGTFIPNNLLSAFDGESTLGNWTLTVSDVVTPDPGTLNTWGITYTHDVVSPPLDVILDGGGNATVNAEDLLYSITVECGGYTVLAGTPPAATVSFDTSDIGLNNVDVIVTNDNGASSTCTAIVNVIGAAGSGITITCPTDITVNNDLGLCGATVTFANATATDVEDGPLATTQTGGPASGSVFPVGITVVEFSATDSDGNTETCTFNITVNDTEDPQITCPADITQPNDPGDPGAVVNYTVSTSDNCPGETLNQTAGLPSGSLFPIGTTTNTFEVTDASGNTATCSFDVTITTTNTPPVITCPANITVANDAGICGATVTFADATATDAEDGPIPTTQTGGPASGSVFPVGITVIEFSATDSDGNTVTCSFDVTVNDTEAPIVTCPADITVDNDLGICGAEVTYALPVITDNCPPDLTNIVVNGSADSGLSGWNITQNGGDGWAITGDNKFISSYNLCIKSQVIDLVAAGYSTTILDASPDIAVSEEYVGGWPNYSDTYFYNAELRDENGNVIASYSTGNLICTAAIQTVNHVFSGYPAGVRYVFIEHGGDDAEFWAGHYGAIIDNSEVIVTVPLSSIQTAGLPSGSVFPVGTTTNTFEVTDASGNTSTCSFDVTVNDTEAPGITCPADIVQSTDPGICDAVVTYTVGTSDNCAGETLTQTAGLASGSVFPLGTTTNVFVVTDANGNSTTCSFDVTINDTEAPTIVCPADVNINNDPGMCSAAVSYPFPVALDNCTVFGTGDIAGFTSLGTFNGKAYYISENPFTPSAAFPDAVANGGLVVTINDAAENTFIRDAVNALFADERILIGLNDVAIEGTFVWPSGEPVTYTNWSPGEPNNTGNEDYVEVFANGLWNDQVNSPPRRYILEVNSTSTIVQIAGLPSGSDFPVGTTTNIFEVTDESGNTATCSFDVTVTDAEAPTITCPADMIVDNDPGVCEAVVNYTIIAADNCAGETMVQTAGLPSGSVFPVGTTTNTFVVTDAVGNSSTCTFTITVNDTEDPVFTGGALVVDQQALANNTCMATFDQTDLAQSFIPSMNSMSGASIFLSDWGAGSGDVTIALYDNLPNAGGTLLATGTAIGVSDNQWADVTWAAVPVTPGNTYYIVFTSTNGGQCVSGDINNGYPNGQVYANGGYQPFPGFDYTFKTFGGGSGGGCPGNITQGNDPGTCEAVVNYTAPVGEDNCAGAVTVQIAGLPSGSTFPVGTTTNTFEVTDASGNTATCSFDVIVNDTEAPVITCPDDLTVEVNEGELYTVPDYFGTGEATATDNCTDPVVNTTQNPTAGTQLGGGVHTITLTATDDSGNVSTCTFELMIEIILGTTDNQELGSIQMYPNPASSSVIIGNPGLIQLERISIYDLNGRLVLNVNKPQNLIETTLDVSNFAAAVYMVQIVSEHGQIIKQLVKE